MHTINQEHTDHHHNHYSGQHYFGFKWGENVREKRRHHHSGAALKQQARASALSLKPALELGRCFALKLGLGVEIRP
eukprot:scaffold170206_cov15-Tisochrysis_lutea.AAC.2